MDVHDKETRSRNMRAIKSRDTKPEVKLRKALHRNGLRYRICPKALIGRPDLYFPKYKAAVFVHGCFWHAHNCDFFQLPKSRISFWQNKLNLNVRRDIRVIKALQSQKIRVLVIWECAIMGKNKLAEAMIVRLVQEWLQAELFFGVIDSLGLKNGAISDPNLDTYFKI